LMLSEFLEMNRSPLQRVYDQESTYTYLKEAQEDAVIVEYPFVASDEAYNYLFQWNQFFHGKKMLNGYALGTEGESLRNCVLNLLDPRTPGLLAYMGVDYVAVHKDMYEKGSEYTYAKQKMDLSDLPDGFRVVNEVGDFAVLEIDAERPDAVVIYDPRFSAVIFPQFGNGWWLGAEKKWSIKIDAECDMVTDIEFSILSIEGERELDIDLGGGREEPFTVGEDCRKIIIPDVRLEGGINRVYLSTEEEPVPYKEIFGGYDSKGLCFAMSFWDLKKK